MLRTVHSGAQGTLDEQVQLALAGGRYPLPWLVVPPLDVHRRPHVADRIDRVAVRDLQGWKRASISARAGDVGMWWAAQNRCVWRTGVFGEAHPPPHACTATPHACGTAQSSLHMPIACLACAEPLCTPVYNHPLPAHLPTRVYDSHHCTCQPPALHTTPPPPPPPHKRTHPQCQPTFQRACCGKSLISSSVSKW